MSVETINIIQFLAAAYDQTEKMTDLKLQAYVAGMAGIDEDRLRRAAQRWVEREKWFPRVAELRAYCQQDNRPIDNGDPLIERLNIEYEQALAGKFDAERMLELIVRLRVSDRQAMADDWRRRYDQLCGATPDDRHALATSWSEHP